MSKQANKYQKEYLKNNPIQEKETKFKTERQRRYYIHSRLKGFIEFDSEKRTVFLPVGRVPSTLKNYINILRDEYGYSVQLIIN
jgi:hypothetical protein